MAETWRLFIALDLPTHVRTTLANLQSVLQQRTAPRVVRWVKPEGTHLTLKFLGDVALTQRPVLEQRLIDSAAHCASFNLQTGPLGCFPDTNHPRVAWLGIQGDSPALLALHNAVETRIAPLGFPTEDRPFSPHLTLGRVQPDTSRSDVERFGRLIAAQPVPEVQLWSVSHVTLFRSELRPSGAVYTALCQAALGLP